MKEGLYTEIGPGFVMTPGFPAQLWEPSKSLCKQCNTGTTHHFTPKHTQESYGVVVHAMPKNSIFPMFVIVMVFWNLKLHQAVL